MTINISENAEKNPMDGLQANVALVRAFIERFWNGGEEGAAETELTADYTDHAYVPGNAEGLLHMARVLKQAFPDQHCAEESVVAEGDRVMLRLRLRGTHLGSFRGTEPTGTKVDVRLFREFRIVDNKIAEHWALLDTASLLRQIGAELHEQPACRLPGA